MRCGWVYHYKIGSRAGIDGVADWLWKEIILAVVDNVVAVELAGKLLVTGVDTECEC